MLNISPDLKLPRETVTSTVLIYGGKGMGKTTLASVIAEELYQNGLKFSVIDPLGVWWGLQHGLTKADPGLEILILGGLHGDIPIEPSSGIVVADLVADERISVVIDISRKANGESWTKEQKVRFVTDYMRRLYERQAEKKYPIMQIIDEAARFAPQKFVYGDKLTPACLDAIETIGSEGRNFGIGLTLISQRSARLNKDVAELADVLMAFRIIGPNSIDAVMDWFGDHIPRERHRELVEQLRKLPRGTAMIISPGWLEIEGVYPIRFRYTFDSSATPKIGDKLAAPGKAHKPDLSKYRERMNEVIDHVLADDPHQLKQKVAALESQIKQAETQIKKLKDKKPDGLDRQSLTRIIEAAQVADRHFAAQRNVLDQLIENAKRSIESAERVAETPDLTKMMSDIIKSISNGFKEITAIPPMRSSEPVMRPSTPVLLKNQTDSSKDGVYEVGTVHSELSKLHREIINSTALLHSIGEEQPTIEQVGAVMGKHHNAGRIRGGFNQTHVMGYSVIESSTIRLTEAGFKEAVIPPIRTARDIHQLWYERISGNELAFLHMLIDAYPAAISLQEMGQQLGKDINAGRVRGALNKLLDKGLASISGNEVVASSLLFPPNLQ